MVGVRLSIFDAGGANEYHAMLEIHDTALDAAAQYRNMAQALTNLQSILPPNAALVLKRYFVSDVVNQAPLIPEEDNVAVSIVQQPPLNGSKLSVWAYWICGASIRSNGKHAIIAERPNYRHLFDMQLHNNNPGEFIQTEGIIYNYTTKLNGQGCTLAGNAIRTWIFVQGVDRHYAGMVKARNLFFHEQGLTSQTHYIASTGIEGKYMYPETLVCMDVYAIEGIGGEQITYLKGATHLNPTHEYGVTFERATAVDYGDRRHIFVSGTASIDNRGQIVFPHDAGKQTERTLENVGVLLNEGGAAMTDVVQMIVYLRDTADYKTVSAYMEKHYRDIPKVIVWAPVCRPGWLVEMECMAVKSIENKRFEAF